VTDALVKGMALILAPIYTRVLNPSAYGILAIASTVTLLLTLTLGLALNAAITRLYFEAESAKDERTLYGTILIFLLVIPGVLTLGLELAGDAGYLDFFRSVPYDPYLRYAVWAAYLGVFLDVPLAIYTTRQEPRKVVGITLFNALTLAAVTILLVVVLREGVLGALRAALITSAAAAVVSVLLTARMAAARFSWMLLKAALLFSLPLIPHLLSQWSLSVSDRIVLQGYVPYAQLGLYSLGASVAAAASLGVNALSRAFTPAVTAQLKREGPQGQVPRIGTFWFAGATWACVFVALFGGDIIRLLTPSSFHQAARVVPVLVFGHLAFGVYQLVTQGTWYSMKTITIPIVTFGAAAVNVGLNLVILPWGGIMTAAWATLIAYVVLAFTQGLLAHRLYPIPWELKRWTKLLVAGALAFVAGTAATGALTVSHIAVELAAVFVAFPLVLLVLAFWTPDERRWLRYRFVVARAALVGRVRLSLGR